MKFPERETKGIVPVCISKGVVSFPVLPAHSRGGIVFQSPPLKMTTLAQVTQGIVTPGKENPRHLLCEKRSLIKSILQSCSSTPVTQTQAVTDSIHTKLHVWECCKIRCLNSTIFLTIRLKCLRKGEAEIRSLALCNQKIHRFQWTGCAKKSLEWSPTRKSQANMGERRQIGKGVL